MRCATPSQSSSPHHKVRGKNLTPHYGKYNILLPPLLNPPAPQSINIIHRHPAAPIPAIFRSVVGLPEGCFPRDTALRTGSSSIVSTYDTFSLGRKSRPAALDMSQPAPLTCMQILAPQDSKRRGEQVFLLAQIVEHAQSTEAAGSREARSKRGNLGRW
jgi:hypothetical protein